MSRPTRRLAVLGDGEPTETVRATVADAGARLVDVAEADAVVAVGDAALREAVVAAAGDSDAPVLPVRVGRRGVDTGRAREAVGRLADGQRDPANDFERAVHPVLAVDSGTEVPRRFAAFDVAFVTAEAARISEYTVAFSDGEAASFRADGAAIATPLGSHRYVNAAGAPSVSPGGGLPVVPIAPFTTRADSWVVTDGIGVTVEREAEPVSLIVDGTRRGVVEPHREVDVGVAARVKLLAPADD